MISPACAHTMAAYNMEMNRRVYGAALRLPDEVRRAEGSVFWHSIHGTLNHLLWADRIWLSRFGACEEPQAGLKDRLRTVDEFASLWEQR